MGPRPSRWSCGGMSSGSRPGDQAPRGPSRGCRRSSACSTIRARSCPTTRSSPSSRDGCPGCGSDGPAPSGRCSCRRSSNRRSRVPRRGAGYRGLVRSHGEPAPGPGGLRACPVAPAVVAGLPYHVFHPFGVERRRAETVRRAARDGAAAGGRARRRHGQATRRPPTGCSVPSRASGRGRRRRSGSERSAIPTR